MINYDTILSTFDDKLTLMQWLQKVEQALEGAGLESVEIHQQSPTTAYFKFVFADGTSVTTPSITLPRGAKGDTGATGATGATGNGIASITKTGTIGLVDTYTILYTNGSTQTFTVTNGAQGEAGQDGQDGADGVGIDNVEINDNTGVLTVTLTDETEINAGNVYNIITISGTSGTITDPATLSILRNKNTVVQRAYNEGLMVWHHTDNLNHKQYFYRVTVDTSILNTGDVVQAQFVVDVSNGTWTYTEETVPFKINPEERILGVDIDGNNVASGRVLKADGNGNVEWQKESGGTKLYQHFLQYSGDTNTPSQVESIRFNFTIISTKATAYTSNDIVNILNTKGKPIYGFGYRYRVDTDPKVYEYITSVTTNTSGYLRFIAINNAVTSYTGGYTLTPNVTMNLYDTIIPIE